MRHNKIIKYVVVVLSQLNYITALLYMFRLLSITIVRSTSNVSTEYDSGHTSVQLPSTSVAEFEQGRV